MQKSLLCGAVLAALALSPAYAADVPVKGPRVAPAPVYSWEGYYVGGNIGWVGYGAKWVDVDGDWGPVGGTVYDQKIGGLTFGVQAGRNYQRGAMVYGWEVDVNYSSASRSEILFFDPTITNTLHGFGTFRGRIGALIQPMTLLYVTGGVALGNFTHTWIEPGDAPDSWQNFAQWRWGWVVGGGIEHAFSPNWTARLEALWMDFGSHTQFNEGGCCRMTVTDTATVVRGAFNWRY